MMKSMTDPATTGTNPKADSSRSVDHDLAPALRLGVTRLARLMRQQSDPGLTPTQLAALATVARRGPVPIGTLADEEQIGAPTATKIVDKLTTAGYVERRADASDRRVSRVSITPAGESLLAEIRARKTAWLDTRLADLSPDELATLGQAVLLIDRLTSPPAAAPPPTDATP